MDEPKDESSPQNEITLSGHFYKSRKQLMFFSALLFMWTLVGMDIPNEPFPNVDVTITNPQAFPIILIVLIVYFGYRSLIEWLISIPANMDKNSVLLKNKVIKLDFYISIAIPIAAVTTFIIQKAFIASFDEGLRYYDILILAFLIIFGGWLGIIFESKRSLSLYLKWEVERKEVELEGADNNEKRDFDERSIRHKKKLIKKIRFFHFRQLLIVIVVIVTLYLLNFQLIFFLSFFIISLFAIPILTFKSRKSRLWMKD